VAFLKEFNEVIHGREPGIVSAAEESTAWPGVSRPTYLGGLGFGFKWNMGWMHDTLAYFQNDPIYRRWHHHELTFSLVYAFTENFILPLSHDEVVHGKGSLINKMPGDHWQRRANLRALYAYMWAHPGKKLLFMGQEFAQEAEWSHERSLDWHLLEQPEHAGIQSLVRDLNHRYRDEPALWEMDSDGTGFWWIEANAAEDNVFAFARRSEDSERVVVFVANLSPVPRHGYRLGLPRSGKWVEALNTDSTYYGGSDVGNLGGVEAEPAGWNSQPFSAEVTLPPLGALWLVPEQSQR
jgi:1,4-alpha-glucan branching enzyme